MLSTRYFLIILIVFSTKGFAQDGLDENKNSKGTNAIYFELLGPAGGGSLNYEHGFYLKKNKNKINGRVGVSYIEAPVIPIGASIEFGKNKSFFQINLNHTFDTRNGNDISNTSLGLAYVRRPIRGFYFHASIYYAIFDEPWEDRGAYYNYFIWPGFGFGYSF